MVVNFNKLNREVTIFCKSEEYGYISRKVYKKDNLPELGTLKVTHAAIADYLRVICQREDEYISDIIRQLSNTALGVKVEQRDTLYTRYLENVLHWKVAHHVTDKSGTLNIYTLDTFCQLSPSIDEIDSCVNMTWLYKFPF